MTKTKMTIHRALSELKLLDAKIQKKTNEITPVGIYQKDKLVNNRFKSEDFSKEAQSDFDSVCDMIERKRNIKRAIVESNGKTEVTISDNKMMVADAITFKEIIDYKKTLIIILNKRLLEATSSINKNNEVVQLNCQKLLESALGKENVKTSNSDVESIQGPYMEKNEFKILDPIEVQSKIKSLQEEVENFESQVDSVLSESNAVTFIEV